MAIKTNMTDLRPRREKHKRVITLVSGGFANRTAFPDGKITVYPWDTDMDNWLTEEAMSAGDSQQESVLYRSVEKLCDLNGCKIEDFVIGDVTSVLLVARSIQNDCIVEYATECPHCRHTESDKITVPDELERVSEKAADYPGTDTVTLPDCADVVVIRPLRVGDEFAITGRTPENRGPISDQLARIITPVVSINATHPDSITELYQWFQALSPKDAKFLENKEDALTPHLNQSVPCECGKCKKRYEHKIVLNGEFFRSGRSTAA